MSLTMNTECDHVQAEHVHGTHACYVLDRCRCDPCRHANTAYEKKRRRWTGEFPIEEHPYTDADQARQIVQTLKRKGMGLKTVASESGIAHGTLWKLIYGMPGRGPSKRVRRETLEALAAVLDGLAFDDYQLAGGAKIPAREAWEIVDELVARGWWKAEIGRRISGNPDSKSLQMGRRFVTVSTLRTLRELTCEPVPKRLHPRGSYYIVQTGHEWQEVRRRVDGVGGPVYFKSKGKLS